MSKPKAKKIYFESGDVFEIALPEGGFAYGRILLYLRRVSLRGGFSSPHWLASFVANSVLVRLTKFRFSDRPPGFEKINSYPAFPTEMLMTRQIRNGQLPIVGNVPVRPEEMDFPEFVCGFGARTMRFSKGAVELSISITLDSNHWWDSLPHGGASFGLSPELVMQSIVDPDVSFQYKQNDLRAHPDRAEVLRLFDVSPTMNYQEMCEHYRVMGPRKMLELSEGKC